MCFGVQEVTGRWPCAPSTCCRPSPPAGQTVWTTEPHLVTLALPESRSPPSLSPECRLPTIHNPVTMSPLPAGLTDCGLCIFLRGLWTKQAALGCTLSMIALGGEGAGGPPGPASPGARGGGWQAGACRLGLWPSLFKLFPLALKIVLCLKWS